jgi:hypothetical protein
LFADPPCDHETASAQAAEIATDRRNVVASVMGRQAPLGPHQGNCPVQLWTETRGDRNVVSGSVRRRQQRIGEFGSERLDDRGHGS